MKFDKPALCHDDLLRLMEERGLEVSDREKAIKSLRSIGYYRLSAYRHEKIGGEFIYDKVKTFDHLLEVYEFDRELRLICLDAIERIEVAFRSVLSDTMSVHCGAFWYTLKSCFRENEDCSRFLETITKQIAKEKRFNPSIQHYYATYDFPNYPPSWMIMEIVSFGFLSRMYSKIRRVYKKKVADCFDISPKVLESWLRSLTYLRNLCAHHARVWDRSFLINRPYIPKKYDGLCLPNHKFAVRAFLMQDLLSSLDNNNEWLVRLQELTERYHICEIGAMGFDRPDWLEHWDSLSNN